ncbi:MAG: 30S ribosomal protein S8 [Candidatus Babeliales bacterium]
MSIDSIGNFLTIIRNGFVLGKRSVEAPFSTLKFDIAQILKEEGFIKDAVLIEKENNKKYIKLFLKYVNGESVIHELTRISKPSNRYYVGAKNVKPVMGNLGLSILTTNKGLMTDKRAKELSVGGEVICSVW